MRNAMQADKRSAGYPFQATDNSTIMFFTPGSESPGRLDDARTPTQSVMPVSRQESNQQNQVDPVLLAMRLANIPQVSSTLQSPEGNTLAETSPTVAT